MGLKKPAVVYVVEKGRVGKNPHFFFLRSRKRRPEEKKTKTRGLYVADKDGLDGSGKTRGLFVSENGQVVKNPARIGEKRESAQVVKNKEITAGFSGEHTCS